MAIRGNQKGKEIYDNKIGDIEITSLFWKFKEKWLCRRLKDTYILLCWRRILFNEFICWKTVKTIITKHPGFYIQSFELTTPSSQLSGIHGLLPPQTRSKWTAQYWFRLIQSHTELVTSKSIIFSEDIFFIAWPGVYRQ